ncbi:MAG: hypothetical protein CVV56_04670 [Tenericutes bacterium HGW-Tenericutes-1]|jgi:hypothetical protein|nr:MAG: hypothetical protein CVV56_04670 [Tenericutes bacterium HGW-Tenericutes-1]
MKKLIISLMMLASVITIAACSSSPAEVFAATDDVFAFQAISATEILAVDQANQEIALDLSYTLLEDTETTEDEPIVADEIDVLDKYLSMMDLYLGDNNGLNVSVETSDDLDYAYKVTFTSKTLSGVDATYILYYNEVLYEESDETTEPVTTEPETTEDTTTETNPLSYQDQEKDRLREKSFEFNDVEDDDVVYVLSGKLIIGENEYFLEGKKVVDEDSEILILRSWVDHDNFVKVRYQSEDGKMKFFYEIVEEGIIINKSKIMILNEDGRLMAKLDFVEGEAKGRYEFRTITEENVTYIKIKYNTVDLEGNEERGLIHITATYDELTNETTYEYTVRPENNQNKEFKYNHRHEDHRGDSNRPENPGMRG